jgi:hypothetical protein
MGGASRRGSLDPSGSAREAANLAVEASLG